MTDYDNDPVSPLADKIEWDEAFERECGYLPERSPVAARRASSDALQLLLCSLQGQTSGHPTQQAQMQSMLHGICCYGAAAGPIGGLFGGIGGAVGGLFG